MNTKLNLTSSGTIELSADISVSLNYSIAELQNIESINGSFSKTITVPGTKNNNKLLKHLYNESSSLVSGGYNTHIQAPCTIDVDEVTVLRGNMRVARVRVLDNNRIEYDLEITGQVGGLFTAIGDLELTDLDFSQYNHLYTYLNQFNSWETSIKINGVDTAFQLGRGYVYPMIDIGTDPLHENYYSDQLYPALYVKEIIDTLFRHINYTYESDFFNSDFFKRLIFNYSGDSFKLSTDTINERILKASTNVDYVYSIVPYDVNNVDINNNTSFTEYKRIQFQNDSTGGNYDGGNQWNTSTSGGIVAATGYYNLSCSLQIQCTNPPNSYHPVSDPIDDFVIFYLYFTKPFQGVEAPYYSTGKIVTMREFSTYYGGTTKTVNLSINNVYVEAGVAFSVCMIASYLPETFAWGGYTTGNTYNIKVLSSSYIKLDVANSVIMPAEEITMESTLPEDYKAADFFKGIVKMFNLYIEVDKDNANNLLIAPRNEFYTSGTTLDWSSKLDRLRGLEIQPTAQLDNREYEFKYKDDTDNYNKKFQEKWYYSYSRKIVKVITDLFKGRKTVELPFAATPCVGYQNSTRVVPAIFTTDGGINKRKKTVPRILYYGGMKTSTPSWKHWDRITNTYSLRTTYPYAGMVDDPYSPTVSLDIGVPNELYWSTDQYTNNNLFNKYYREMVDEMTDPDSRIVTGYFKLNPYDMSILDFRNTIYIDGVNYHINKIEDYNPVIDSLTKVELIKIKKTKSFEATTMSLDGAVGTEVDFTDIPHLDIFDLYPVRGKDTFQVNSVGFESDSYVSGLNNLVDEASGSVRVTGDRNNVSDSRYVDLLNSDNNTIQSSERVSMVNTSGSVVYAYARNVSLINSSGITVMPNVRNVSVVNSSGIIVDQSNTIVKANIVEVNGMVTSGAAKEYVANIFYSAPDLYVQVLYNTLGNISWSRSAANNYRGVLIGAFPVDKTSVTFTLASDGTYDMAARAGRADDDTIYVRKSAYSASTEDFERSTIIIKVYP